MAYNVLLSLLVTCVLCRDLTDARTQPQLYLHHHMSETDLQKFFGVTSHEQVPEYEIAFANEDEEAEPGSRRRRDSQSGTRKSFTLKTSQSAMHLTLEPDNEVKSPNLVVRTYHEDGSRSDSDASHVQLYSGHVTGHPGSKVLVSEQEEGLTGIVHLNRDEYHVRPLPASFAKAHGYGGAGKVHVVHRRSLKGSTRSRQKRQQIKTKHKVLEMTLVADEFTIGIYGNEITDHILLLAHITRNLFLDDSIGPVRINLVVIGIILRRNGFGYKKTASVQKRLEFVGNWSDENLPSNDTHPDHPDTVVLFTTNVIGWATIPSTCYSYYKMGRAVVGDKSLATATIMAHETAHTFGIDHDGKGANGICPNFQNIMATITSKGRAAFTWSRCSRNGIQNFLRGPKSKCLDDGPQRSVLPNRLSSTLRRLLPGELKSRTVQCQMLFGQGYTNCRHTPDDCQLLYCEKKGSTGYYVCPHKLIPPAEGSKCGPRHWCVRGQCVDNAKPRIDGGWTPWSTTYSHCSRPCGGGLRWKTRECTNPKPSNDGKPCQGEAKGHFKRCNTKDCPPGTLDDRISQCKALDPKYRNTIYFNDKCLLGCTTTRTDWGWKRGPVKDGTRCYKDRNIKDVCIKGKCRTVACDGKIDSKVQRDRCGKCNGDSSSCAYVSGEYNAPCKAHYGNRVCDVLTIPVGSKNIKVEKKWNYKYSCIGIEDKYRQYVTKYFPSISEDVVVAGTLVSYFRTHSYFKDRVTIKGPTTEVLYIVTMTSRRNTGITYSLLDPTKTTAVKPQDFQWKASMWTPCSRTCGKGKQSRSLTCTRKDDGTYVGDHACRTRTKPMGVRECHVKPCPVRWHVGEWTPCSKTCGVGIQTRTIVCRQEMADNVFHIVPSGQHSKCPRWKPRVPKKTVCRTELACPVQWLLSAWSKCSCSGVSTRSLSCGRRSRLDKMVTLHPSICENVLPRPAIHKPCTPPVPCGRG